MTDDGQTRGDDERLASAESEAAREAALEVSAADETVPGDLALAQDVYGGRDEEVLRPAEPADEEPEEEEAGAAETTGVPAGAGGARPEHAEIRQGGANRVEADSVAITQGGAGFVRAREVTVTQGGIGFAVADEIELEEDANASFVVAREAEFEDDSRALVVIAGRVTGGVRPLLDWRGAAALGVSIGVTLSILGRLRRR